MRINSGRFRHLQGRPATHLRGLQWNPVPRGCWASGADVGFEPARTRLSGIGGRLATGGQLGELQWRSYLNRSISTLRTRISSGVAVTYRATVRTSVPLCTRIRRSSHPSISSVLDS